MKRTDYTIEVCANSVQSCIAAQQGGADRVELCAALAEGGITPSFATIALARANTDIALHVIVRPRGGDFLYTALEVDTMEADINAMRSLQVDGVVVGCLTADGDIDLRTLDRLMEAAQGLPVTFHRAFDRCRDPLTAVRQLRAAGVARILTSGQQPTAPEGTDLLRQLVSEAGPQLSIMPGCGVNENNIRQLAADTGAHEFHFSASTPVKSQMRIRNDQVVMGAAGVDEYTCTETSATRVRRTIEALCGL